MIRRWLWPCPNSVAEGGGASQWVSASIAFLERQYGVFRMSGFAHRVPQFPCPHAHYLVRTKRKPQPLPAGVLFGGA